jgi:hypothetical protein
VEREKLSDSGPCTGRSPPNGMACRLPGGLTGWSVLNFSFSYKVSADQAADFCLIDKASRDVCNPKRPNDMITLTSVFTLNQCSAILRAATSSQ